MRTPARVSMWSRGVSIRQTACSKPCLTGPSGLGHELGPGPYTVKLEGAALAGYRAISICGTRDPLLISTLDDFLARIHDAVAMKAAALGFPKEAGIW